MTISGNQKLIIIPILKPPWVKCDVFGGNFIDIKYINILRIFHVFLVIWYENMYNHLKQFFFFLDLFNVSSLFSLRHHVKVMFEFNPHHHL